MSNNKKGAADANISIVNVNDLQGDIYTDSEGEVVDINNGTPKIRTGFNNRGTINLDELEKLPKIDFKDAKFIEFGWLDLTTVDLNDANWKNIGIRAVDDADNRIDSFRVSFSRRGYDMSEFPPCIDTDDNPLEGRGRIKAAIKNGERWMPIARYSRSDTSDRNTVTNGLRANQKKPVYMSVFDDYVNAGVGLIAKGELEADIQAIDNWLYREVKIDNVIDNSRGGTITKIKNKILERSKIDSSLIWSLSKTDAEKWITTNLGLAKADFVLINMADNETYAERAWRHVRDALKNGREPVNLIFYTTDYSPTAARAGLKKSMEYVENLYRDSWEVVMSQLPAVVKLEIPETRPFIFMGALPQIVQNHKINGHHLVPVDKY